jgi:Flp pilus assembly protein TadB
MAQTKRKRRTKHRGTAAGTIEARGRTGRPLSADEKRKQQRQTAREQRLNTPPTWKSSATRASIAAVIVFVFILVTAKGSNKLLTAVEFTAVALIFYIPAGYYLELTLYRRRQRKKLGGSGDGTRR